MTIVVLEGCTYQSFQTGLCKSDGGHWGVNLFMNNFVWGTFVCTLRRQNTEIAGMSLTKCPGRVWQVTSRLGTGISKSFFTVYTDKKENQNFPIYKEIQNGAVAKSYITNGLLLYGEIFPHFLIYWEAFLQYDFATATL
jgi:hypothetical protein